MHAQQWVFYLFAVGIFKFSGGTFDFTDVKARGSHLFFFPKYL